MQRFAIALVLLGAAFVGVVGTVAAKDDGSLARSPTVSPKQLTNAGWDCVDPGYWLHCSPPGSNIGKAPPVIVSLNFYTRDTEATSARFLGFEDLIRFDIWKALPRRWPCGENGKYRRVPGKSLPAPGYMYCHHFDDRIPLPPR